MGEGALRPMLGLEEAAPFDSAAYAYEVKWDGVRCLAHCQEGRTSLVARNGSEVVGLFPELADLHSRLPAAALPVVLDGEIIIPDGRGHPVPAEVQRRLAGRAGRGAQRAATYCLFDVLTWQGRQVLEMPWTQRRELLSRLLPHPLPHACISEAFDDQGVALFEAVTERGLEGIVAKRLQAPYRPGERSSDWLEIRSARVGEFVIGGYTISGGRRLKDFATLLLGCHPSASEEQALGLTFVGETAGGFQDDLRELLGELESRHQSQSPFAGELPTQALIFFTRPELVAEVRYASLGPLGRLRFAVFMRLRRDVDPRDCRPPAGPRGVGAVPASA